MSPTYNINSIHQAHQLLGLAPPKHPLISVIRPEEVKLVSEVFQSAKVVLNFYQITFKQLGCGVLQYGRNTYDYEEGTLIFMAPGQVVQYDPAALETPSGHGGWTLAFHPDLIRKSNLVDKLDRYAFFSYDVNEALHLSEAEKATIEGILAQISREYQQNLDRHSQNLIVANLELFLDYCLRFYDRQFYTRTNLNSDIVSKFERLLKTYYETGKADELGLPNVHYCAQALHLSARYLSDLLKKETSKTAQEHIHHFVLEKAKNSLLNSTDSISSIGYALGFGYPQHFSNLFKSKTGMSPREYRHLN